MYRHVDMGFKVVLLLDSIDKLQSLVPDHWWTYRDSVVSQVSTQRQIEEGEITVAEGIARSLYERTLRSTPYHVKELFHSRGASSVSNHVKSS